MRSAEVAVEVRDGRKLYRQGDVVSIQACEYCGVPIVPRSALQRTCGEERCQAKRRNQSKRESARQTALCRERNRRWAAKNRGCRKRHPWLLGKPPYGTHLPGGGVELSVSPYPRWPVELRNTRAVHGMVTSLVGAHRPRHPRWALVPWDCGLGWGLYLWEDQVIARLAKKQFDVRLYDKPTKIAVGPARWLRSPTVRKRGRQRLRVDAITPVVIQNTTLNRSHMYATPSALLGCISTEFMQRLGVDYVDPKDLRVEKVYADSHPCKTQMGGKYGPVTGWTGHIVVECNAPAAWLLKCAGLVGLGSRTAFGFGRARVTDVD